MVVIDVVFCVGVMLIFSWVQSVGEGLSGIGKGFEQLGQALGISGTAADAAARVTASQPPGSVNVSVLNADLPEFQWLYGTMSVPSSSLRHPIVGVNIVGTDVETAVRLSGGLCSLGLSVTSPTDTLIAEDHLPGPGTYYQLVPQRAQCVAGQPPASSWMVWSGTP
jgi:hypothetical protein